MFEEVFLPGIIEECSFYERTIYHLAGPGALKHLDSLLEIKELDAIQWVAWTHNIIFYTGVCMLQFFYCVKKFYMLY